jgi:hypothetical protein
MISLIAACGDNPRPQATSSVMERIERAAKNSDDFDQFKQIFLESFKSLYEDGICKEADFADFGFWASVY